VMFATIVIDLDTQQVARLRSWATTRSGWTVLRLKPSVLPFLPVTNVGS
jgi:hypothetical protein